MRIRLLGYFLRKALGNIWSNPFLSLVTLSTIAISMLILGLFVLIYLNVQGFLHQLGDELQITAYLKATLFRSTLACWVEKVAFRYAVTCSSSPS